MKPGTWRAVHWLAYLSWPVALAHTFGMGTDAGEPWVIGLGVACILSVAVALLWRVRRASRQRRCAMPTARSRCAAQAPGAHAHEAGRRP